MPRSDAARNRERLLADLLLTEIWQVQQELTGLFVVLLRSDVGRRNLRVLSDRTRTTKERGTEAARSAGALHPDVAVDTVKQVLVMLPGAAPGRLTPPVPFWQAAGHEHRAALGARGDLARRARAAPLRRG